MDGDRTNITYYSDVRVDDKYRLGEVNGGWTVLRAALNVEHGVVERDAAGLQKIRDHVRTRLTDGRGGGQRRRDCSQKRANGRQCSTTSPSHTGSAAALPGWRLRSATGDVRACCDRANDARRQPRPDGHPRRRVDLPIDGDRAADDGAAEYIFRLALPTGVYGGTLEVFRNMIAEHALGLGRPNYSAPANR